MERDVKEITMEELIKLIQSQEREFIIHVEPREGDVFGTTKSIST